MKVNTRAAPKPGQYVEGVRIVIAATPTDVPGNAWALLLNPVEPYYSLALVSLFDSVGWMVIRATPYREVVNAVARFTKETR